MFTLNRYLDRDGHIFKIEQLFDSSNGSYHVCKAQIHMYILFRIYSSIVTSHTYLLILIAN